MIVDSMTHEEVFLELERDRENLNRRVQHFCMDIRKWAKRMDGGIFPRDFTLDYTSPRKVRYIVVVRAFTKRAKAVTVCILAVRQTTEGMAAYSTNVKGYIVTPTVILPHALKRYAERAKVDKHGIELVHHFLVHNQDTEDNSDQKAVGRSVRYKGFDHVSVCISDGVLLGQTKGRIYEAHTFITYDMCFEQQRESFEATRRSIPDDRDAYSIALLGHRKNYMPP